MRLDRDSTLAEVAAAVASALENAGIGAVLTGGSCATVYTAGIYQSRDLDFIIRRGGTRQSLDAAMATVGFARDVDRYVHADTSFYVEFPRGPLAIGADLDIRPVRLNVGPGSTMALSATDSCRDRLAAFYHWSDRQSLNTAVEIARRHRVDMGAIKVWSAREGAAEKFEEFRREVRRRRKDR